MVLSPVGLDSALTYADLSSEYRVPSMGLAASGKTSPENVIIYCQNVTEFCHHSQGGPWDMFYNDNTTKNIAICWPHGPVIFCSNFASFIHAHTYVSDA